MEPTAPQQPTPPSAPTKGKAKVSIYFTSIFLSAPVSLHPPTMMTLAPTKALGMPLEPFDGSSTKAKAFWTNLANYYYLNNDLYFTPSRKITSALTHFKLGTLAGEWAKDKQQAALAMTHSDFGSWTNFQDAFKVHFIPGNAKLLSTQQMHSLQMGNRPFTDWYQEWSTHASWSDANDETKMYAFHQNLLSALHNKILGVSLALTTLPHRAC
jgi:hypothetical protein